MKVNDRMSQLDEKIEKAKRLFKMRIDQSKKFAQGEEGNNSGRIHVGQVNEAVSSAKYDYHIDANKYHFIGRQ